MPLVWGLAFTFIIIIFLFIWLALSLLAAARCCMGKAVCCLLYD